MPQPPIFPAFVWDDYFWTTSAPLPAWRGFRTRGEPGGTESDLAEAARVVRICFAPEGRAEGPLTPTEIALVRWVVDHESAIHDALVDRLFHEYPTMRAQAQDWFDPDELDELMPEVSTPRQLKSMIGVGSINVHQIARDGKPYIGVELGCGWDEEHGLGVLLHGDVPLEVGGADTAILLWKAEQYAKA